MFFTASVVDGFRVVLGSMPYQFGMFLTMLFIVPVPEFEGKTDSEARMTYWVVLLVHLILFFQILVNHYFSTKSPTMASITNVLLIFVQVMTQIYVCVNWVFNPEHTQEWLDARQSHDWIQFWQWCYIEILVFCGYLVSAILFNFVYFFR